LRAAAWKLKPARKPVSVRAQVGEIFPPLALVRRMSDGMRPGFQVLAEGSGREGACGAEVMHIGIRLPGFDLRHRGNLSRSEQEMVLRWLGAELEKQFDWRIARTTFDGNTHAFCYPYLRNTEESVVFCRLEVKDYIAADPARTAGVAA
jgi:hypothetical protein